MDHTPSIILYQYSRICRIKTQISEAYAFCTTSVFQSATRPVQRTIVDKLLSIEVYLKHRIFRPVLLKSLHLQSLEEVLAALEVILEGGDQQRLAEVAGTAKEIDALYTGQLIDRFGFVYIYEATIDYACKILYADGILSHNLLSLANLQKIVGTR